jgi:PBSX family phage terminase large subunit
MAEGAVFDTFDCSTCVIPFPPGNPQYTLVGVDYGTNNPTSFVSISVNLSKFPNIWVDDVYFYDSKAHQRQKTDNEYAADLKKFIVGKPLRAIYIDPSAASFKLECAKHDIPNIYDAENEVLDGIRLLGDFFNKGTLKICRHCEQLIKDIQSYVWDSKCAMTGVDKPLKQNDHTIDALRYAVYSHFYNKPHISLSAHDIDRAYNESRGIGPNLPEPFRDPREYY